MPRGIPKSGKRAKRSLPKHRCTAKATGTQERCKNPAIPGGTVCKRHGGLAPQVQAAARLRLESMVHPALTALAALLVKATQKEHPATALGAVNSVLDRTGYSKTTQIQLGGSVSLIDAAGLATLSPHELRQWDALLAKIEAQQGAPRG